MPGPRRDLVRRRAVPDVRSVGARVDAAAVLRGARGRAPAGSRRRHAQARPGGGAATAPKSSPSRRNPADAASAESSQTSCVGRCRRRTIHVAAAAPPRPARKTSSPVSEKSCRRRLRGISASRPRRRHDPPGRPLHGNANTLAGLLRRALFAGQIRRVRAARPVRGPPQARRPLRLRVGPLRGGGVRGGV